MTLIDQIAFAIANGGDWNDENYYNDHQRNFHRRRAIKALRIVLDWVSAGPTAVRDAEIEIEQFEADHG